jgi:predicted ATPase/class 3 adenylate cyclase
MPDSTDQGTHILTFLYTDIEGSTRLWEGFPDTAEALVARQEGIVRGAVESQRGWVFRTVGDGLCAAFANASQAVQAALQAQLALHAEAWGDAGPLRVRMALHTGEAEKHGSDYSGSSLNRIGRLLGLAHGGQALLSGATQLLVRDALPQGVTLQDLGEIRLRDLTNPERIFQLCHPSLPADFPSLSSLDRHPNNLPTQTTALVGRQAELAEVLDRLCSPQVRLLTLIGPGGTGKTRLSLQAAAELVGRFKDGVYFVDLAPIRDPAAVLPAIARTIGIRETSQRPLVDEMKEQLKDREMLLLLDNLEQVTGVAPQLAELLQSGSHLKMLVTSREALHLRAEQLLPVPPLSLPPSGLKQIISLETLAGSEAVRLFVERAQAVRPGFQLTQDNAAAVAEICRRLDGLPLAIELAASRVRLFSPQALLERLESHSRLLSGGARDLPARQQALRDTIGWSYQLLDETSQSLFQVVSVFPGGGTVEAIEAVAGQTPRLRDMDIFDGLAALVDKSLLRQSSQLDGETHLGMLGTIREYAAEKLAEETAFQAETLRAHAAYFAAFSQRQWEGMRGTLGTPNLDQMAAEIENLRAAWRYWVTQADLEQLGKFIDGLWLLYDTRGWMHAMIDLTNDLLKVLEANPPTPELARQEIVLQASLASALLSTKGYVSDEVEQAYTRTLQLIEQQGEIPELLPVLRGLARYYSYRGDFDKAVRVGEHALRLADQLDDNQMRLVGHLTLGTNYAFTTDILLGLEHLEKGIACYKPGSHHLGRFRSGTDPGVACYITSSMILWMVGYPEKALARAIEAVDITTRQQHPFSMAYSLFHTSLLHLWSGKVQAAEGYVHRLLDLAEEYDFTIWTAVGTCLHGSILVNLDQHEQGLQQIQWGMERYLGLKSPPIFWSMLVYNQAQAYLQTGQAQKGLDLLFENMASLDPSNEGALLADFYRLLGDLLLGVTPNNGAEAENWYQQALQIARQHKVHTPALRAGVSLGRLWQEQGKHDQARQVVGEVYGVMTEGFELADMVEAKGLLEEWIRQS